MLRVLQLGPLPPPWGGVQTNIDGIQYFLRQQGAETAGINLTRNRRTSTSEAYFPSSPFEVLSLLWRLPHRIVHLHLGGDLSPRLLALCLAVTSIPGKRSVLSFHSGGYPGSSEGLATTASSLRAFCFRRFDRVIAVNQELLDLFYRCGVERDCGRLIPPYWVPSDPPVLDTGPIGEFRQRHNPLLISVGLLEREYDLALQIESLGAIRQQHSNAGLLMIGSGSLEGDLRRRIAAQPWRSSILLCGDVPRPQTLAAISAADVLWRTTLYDGDAVSVREALHFGTPVVATDNGMRPAGIRLARTGDSGELVQQTLEALASPRPERLPQQGEANLRAVYDLYRELV